MRFYNFSNIEHYVITCIIILKWCGLFMKSVCCVHKIYVLQKVYGEQFLI